jgi:hypothetical protein
MAISDRLFGWAFKREPTLEDRKDPVSFTPKVEDDGALVVAAGGVSPTYIDLEGIVKTEAELVTKYRMMAENHELDTAIEEIVNEAIVMSDDEPVVEIVLDEEENIPENIRGIIEQEFEEVLELLEFNEEAYDLFKTWYIDGRLIFHVIIDPNDPAEGIQEVRYVDPRKIRKVREIEKKKDNVTGVVGFSTKNEYFIYNDGGFNSSKGNNSAINSGGVKGVRIANDAIVHVTSGITDANNSMVLSYLHKAIKPLNQLRALEDATVIYTISRAPERRIFYIDVGNLPKMKAEQYIRDLMIRHKNKLVYDASTGEVKDDRKFMTMLEDYWLPRFAGGRGTEIDTLPAGQNLGEMDHVNYFQKRLYKSLNVPNSRLDSENSIYSLGRATEISRDEIKFAKFITRVRKKFSRLFLKLLEKQLVLKGIMTVEEFNKEYKSHINFRYNRDNNFDELKKIEIMNDRFNLLQQMSMFVGVYYSHEHIRKNVLKQTDEEIAEIDAQIKKELTMPQYQVPIEVDPSAMLKPNDTMKDKNKPNKREN